MLPGYADAAIAPIDFPIAPAEAVKRVCQQHVSLTHNNSKS